jgi:glycine/D-amino acid oxidase-like deaminating enzyme
MIDVFPQLRPCNIDYYWSGFVGFTFDQMPHLGK